MDIGAPLHRVALGFAGLMVALAVVLSLTPVATAPANDRPAAFSGSPGEAPKPAGRLNPDAKPVKVPATKAADDKAADLPEVSNAAGEPLEVSGDCAEN